MKTHIITLSSAANQGSSGAFKYFKSYSVNFNALTANEYKVYFSLQTGAITTNTVNIALLSVDLGQQTNLSTSVSSSKSTFLGLLKKQIIGTTNSSYRADIQDNKAITIPRPTNNNITVQIYDETGTSQFDFNADYILNIYFEEI